MPAPYSQAVFLGPAPDVYPQWEKYVKEGFLASLSVDAPGSRAAAYNIIPNPMGRLPPDDSTSLILLESENLRCLQRDDLRALTQLSASPVDSRSYKRIESFDPLGLGPVG